MPVQLELRVVNPTLSTHEALRLDCALVNDDTARTIPSAYDRSGSLQIGLFSGDELVRVMDRRSRQHMMSGGRIDSSLDLDSIEPLGTWRWDMDLASYHYPIPPGEYSLRAAYVYAPAEIRADWGPHVVRVVEDPLRAVHVIRDNPILDGLTLLLEAGSEGGSSWFLRLHNYQRPCGAWWSARVAEGEAPVAAFCASTAYFQTASTEPFHRRWLVWADRARVLRARLYDRGEPTSEAREGILPAGATLVPFAVVATDQALLLFLWSATGQLECHSLENNGLVKQFEHSMPCGPGTLLSIGADEEAVHIAAAWRGILHDRVGYNGALIRRQQAFRSRLRPYSIRCEPSEQRIKAVFVEGGAGRSLEMAIASTVDDTTHTHIIDSYPIHDDLRELDFDRDQSGRFHLLISTAGRRLYYLSERRGPVLVAEGEDRFFPVIAAPQEVYVGCYRRKYGYRFGHYQRRRQGAKIVGLDLHG
jgi:hypothetical protein